MLTILFKLLALVGFGVMFVWTLITGRESVPLTDRTQIITISEEEAGSLGAQAFDEVLREHRVIKSGPQAELVAEVAARIARAADEITETDYSWQAVLLDSADANAFALPGGKIAVLSGLFQVVENENQLAAVIGHELAHVLARHGAERMTQQKLAERGRLAVGIAIGDLDPATQGAVLGALGLGAQFGVLMPFSRIHEREADRIGMILMARACFDPAAAVEVWTNMAKRVGEGPPEFISTHPSHGSRIEALNESLEEARSEQEKADCSVPDNAW